MTTITKENLTPTLMAHVAKVREQHLQKLKAMKARGASKQYCYGNFPKSFVDANY